DDASHGSAELAALDLELDGLAVLLQRDDLAVDLREAGLGIAVLDVVRRRELAERLLLQAEAPYGELDLRLVGHAGDLGLGDGLLRGLDVGPRRGEGSLRLLEVDGA